LIVSFHIGCNNQQTCLCFQITCYMNCSTSLRLKFWLQKRCRNIHWKDKTIVNLKSNSGTTVSVNEIFAKIVNFIRTKTWETKTINVNIYFKVLQTFIISMFGFKIVNWNVSFTKVTTQFSDNCFPISWTFNETLQNYFFQQMA
jgi:hypothetical protein